MVKFYLPDRIVDAHGTITPRDSGMPVGGHSQADVLYRELCEEKQKNAVLQQQSDACWADMCDANEQHQLAIIELNKTKEKLAAQERLTIQWRNAAIDRSRDAQTQREIADAATDAIDRLMGNYDPAVAEAKRERTADFDLLASRGAVS